MAQSKVEAYIGFCIKSKSVVYGNYAIGLIKSGVCLLIMDETAANNTKKFALKYKKAFSCPLIIIKNFHKIINKPECKLIAIRNKSLADAILKCGNEYEIYGGGGE